MSVVQIHPPRPTKGGSVFMSNQFPADMEEVAEVIESLAKMVVSPLMTMNHTTRGATYNLLIQLSEHCKTIGVDAEGRAVHVCMTLGVADGYPPRSTQGG